MARLHLPTRILLGSIQAFLATTVFLWPLVALMSPMMFDAPGSTEDPAAIASFLVLIGYPIPILAGNIGFWAASRSNAVKKMWVWTAVSLMSPVTPILVMITLDL